MYIEFNADRIVFGLFVVLIGIVDSVNVGRGGKWADMRILFYSQSCRSKV